MRECSGISDVTNRWRHFIAITVATLACRAGSTCTSHRDGHTSCEHVRM
jgi:hypothetical protein